MWVISGPFDGIQEGVKEKLLKPGTTYTVGRAKSGQSLLNRINLEQKAISHEHVEIIVGNYEIDDVSDSQAKPDVQLVVKREKDIMVSNQRVSKGMVFDLEVGSEIALTNKISIYLLWKPVVVVNADNRVKKERMRDIAAAAAKIGVTISKTWKDNTTHFVTPSVNMSRRALHSLMLGIPLVDMKWLEELFRRGNTLTVESEPDEYGIVALESHFVLPDEHDFRPKLVKSDDEDEDITEWPIELWDANSERKTIWNGLQFHFFCDDTAPTEWTDQVQLGGGTFMSHNFNPEHGGEPVTTVEEAKNLFQNIRLGAGKLSKVPGMMSPVVIVVKPSELVALLGKSTWKLYQEGMKVNGFKHVTPKDITLAALRVDITFIDCGLEVFEASVPSAQPPRKSTTSASSSFPSVVPPSHTGDMSASGIPSVVTTSASGVPEPPEPDPAPELPRARPLKKLRPQSREPSVVPSPKPAAPAAFPEPVEDKQDLVSEVPRPRLLKRRVKTTTIAEALGLDDSSASITPVFPPDEGPKPPSPKLVTKKLEKVKPPSSTAIQESTQTTIPTTSRPNRLKRRADVLAERTTAAPPAMEIDIPEAPALKRYRQLFEGVERAASSVIDVDGGSTVGTTAPVQPLQPPVATDENRKRKSADRDQDDDVNMGDVTRVKRRVPASGLSQKPGQLDEDLPDAEPGVESQAAVKSPLSPSSQAHTRAPRPRGAAPGAPDKDSALLDALAQTEHEQASTSKGAKSKGTKTAPVDKEFSNMRIAEKEKEEASRRRAEEMRVWEECERDVNVRGNFMVVELVELVRRNRGPPARSINPAWEGKPDFKKFKKKATGPRVARVPVFVNNDENLDYGMGDDYWEQKAALAGVRGSSEGPHTNARVQDDDSDTPVPNTARARSRKPIQAATNPKASVITEPQVKPRPKPQRITISSDESDEDELTKLKGTSSNVGIGKRRPIIGLARKTNLADFGMRDEDSDSGSRERPRRGARQEEQSYGSSMRAGDEDAVSHMVEQESPQVTTTGALSHMSSLGGASLGVRKPTPSGSSVAKLNKPKKVVVADSDSDGGGFKGFGTKRRKRGGL